MLEAGKGIRMDPEKVKAIFEWCTPSNVKAVPCQFLQKVYTDFSDIVAPLIALTKKEQGFNWTFTAEAAFQKLKKLFTTAPIFGGLTRGVILGGHFREGHFFVGHLFVRILSVLLGPPYLLLRPH